MLYVWDNFETENAIWEHLIQICCYYVELTDKCVICVYSTAAVVSHGRESSPNKLGFIPCPLTTEVYALRTNGRCDYEIFEIISQEPNHFTTLLYLWLTYSCIEAEYGISAYCDIAGMGK